MRTVCGSWEARRSAGKEAGGRARVSENEQGAGERGSAGARRVARNQKSEGMRSVSAAAAG
eukprot:scaffold164017_cov31-Tisochrysis_lutea.AAC.1